MFNPKDCPAFNKGRWYEFLVESDGSAYTLTTSDLEGTEINSNYLKFPKDFHVVDFLTDINPIDIATATNYNDIIHLYTDSRHGFMLPNKNLFDWCKVYIFGYFS